MDRIWGKWQGLYARAPERVNAALSVAHRRRTDEAAVLLQIICPGEGLRKKAYGTKMLRFINPALYVVLDEQLRNELGLAESDYDAFASHCQRIGRQANMTAGDVESALYAYVQVNNPTQRSNDWLWARSKLMRDDSGSS